MPCCLSRSADRLCRHNNSNHFGRNSNWWFLFWVQIFKLLFSAKTKTTTTNDKKGRERYSPALVFVFVFALLWFEDMVRLTTELVAKAPSYINPVKDRELDLRGNRIPQIENLAVSKVSIPLLRLFV